MDSIHNWLNNILGHFPFLLMTMDGKPKINATRIIESVIYAVVGGLLSSYVTLKVLDYRMGEVERKMDRMYYDFYKPIYPERGQ